MNIDSDFNDEDLYLLDLITVAECSVKNHLNISDYESISEGGVIPPSVVHSMLLLIGNLYLNREPVGFNKVVTIPYTYEYLLAPYKQYKSF